MPRIAKWKEKSKCVKYNKFYYDTAPFDRLYVSLNHYIDKTIEEALANGYKTVDDFSQFVSVKEVPKWET